jgi:hypothetical protein
MTENKSEYSLYFLEFMNRLGDINDEADIERFAIDYDIHKFEVYKLLSNLKGKLKDE